MIAVCETVSVLVVRAVGLMVVRVLSLACDDAVIVDAFREVLSMLDEVCTVNVIVLKYFYT